jgi:HlyD family secretion protein
VATATVTRGPLTATTTAEGRSRIRDLYVVTAPVDGDLERVTLEAGDSVSPGTVIARIGPAAPRPLDARSRAAAEAAVTSARAALAEAVARQAEARGAAVHVDSELATARRLVAGGAIPRQAVERAEHEAEIRRRTVEAAGAAVEVARSEVARAETQLGSGVGAGSRPASKVRAPLAGRVLRVVRRSGGPVAAGEPLFELGNLATLEFQVDLLTADAMLVEPGAEATIGGWSGSPPLVARVRRVEPAAFTKISALGLEEQRVRVVLDLAKEPPAALGHDFRVTVSIATWSGTDVLTVPSTALFRVGESWAVFVVDGGRARRRRVSAGRSDGRRTAIETGVSAGEEVIIQPSDVIRDGTRVARAPMP